MNSLIPKYKFFAIMRNLPEEKLDQTIDALYAGGIRLFEITFNGADRDTERKTAGTIERIYTRYGDQVECAAGTVLRPEWVLTAKKAGATCIVAPNTDIRVGELAHENGMFWCPGAYTPSEIVSAYHMGADVVKIFPITPDNIGYLRTILPPLAGIPFMPTGGVNPDTVKTFMELGASLLGAGATIITKTALAAGNYQEITANAKAHLAGMEAYL